MVWRYGGKEEEGIEDWRELYMEERAENNGREARKEGGREVEEGRKGGREEDM